MIPQWNFNSQPNESTTEYVTGLYNTFLLRAPDSGGLSGLVAGINGGSLTRYTAYQSMVTSSEYNTRGLDTADNADYEQIPDWAFNLLLPALGITGIALGAWIGYRIYKRWKATGGSDGEI